MSIIVLLLELIPCLLIGYLLGRFREDLSLLVALPLINFGIPISLMGLILKAGLDFPLIQSAVIALVAIGLLMTTLIFNPLLKNCIHSQTLKLGSGFGNTGYFGIPVSLAILPNEALIYSIGFDLGATLVIWGLGPSLLTKKSKKLSSLEYFKNILKALSNSPASKGLIGALIIHLSPWQEQITAFLWIPSRIVIVLALVIVGMRLGWLQKANHSTIKRQINQIKNTLLIKLVGLPSLMWIICFLLGLPNLMTDALVLQAAAPTAISVLLIAQAKSQDADKATSLVIFSTLIALFSIPIWSLILKY
tara:strand:- start:90 stop:1007 length:918 start_codon:yes stop_codon:yes gene_type:complete